MKEVRLVGLRPAALGEEAPPAADRPLEASSKGAPPAVEQRPAEPARETMPDEEPHREASDGERPPAAQAEEAPPPADRRSAAPVDGAPPAAGQPAGSRAVPSSDAFAIGCVAAVPGSKSRSTAAGQGCLGAARSVF